MSKRRSVYRRIPGKKPKTGQPVQSKLDPTDVISHIGGGQKMDPEKIQQFNKAIRAVFESLATDKEPKMFQCLHCGGFHSLDVHCSNCDVDTKAQQMLAMDRPDHVLAFASCKRCRAVSMALFKCKGIDPAVKELNDLMCGKDG